MSTLRDLTGVVGVCLLLSACHGTSTPLEGESRGLLFPVLRTDIEFSRSDGRGRLGRGILGLEMAMSGGEGDFVPRNGTFHKSEFQLVDTHVAFRAGGELDRRIRIEGLVGVEFSHMELRSGLLTSPRETEVSNSIGPMLGLQLSVDVLEDRLVFYGRASHGFGFGETETEKVESGFRYAVSESTQLLLAYRWWEYQDEHMHFNNVRVDLDLEMRGLVIGMEARF